MDDHFGFDLGTQPPSHWLLIGHASGGTGTLTLDETQPIPQTVLVRCLKLSANGASSGHRVGVANYGYWGIPVKPNTTYRASFWAKSDGNATGPLTIALESSDGKTVWASARVSKITGEWKKVTVTLRTGKNITPSSTNRFVLSTETPGTFYFNLVSLFPPTFNHRPNGNRSDLMQMLVDMKPAFLRLPGGNYLEGNTIAQRFPWKQTLGPLEQRPGHMGTWSYRSSDGMGLLEFMEWCEDMKAEPLLAVFAGYALNKEVVPAGPALQPFVDEALEEIEYTLGDTNTKWGAQRAKGRTSQTVPAAFCGNR